MRDSVPSQRLKQFYLHSTWTDHIHSHFNRASDTRSCRHPRCCHRIVRESAAEILDHWTNVHRVPSSRKLTMKNRGTSTETSRGLADAEELVSIADEYVADCYVNHTETSFGHVHTKASKILLLENTEARNANSGGGAVQQPSQDNGCPQSIVPSSPRTSVGVGCSAVECSRIDLFRVHPDLDTHDGYSRSERRGSENDAPRKRSRLEDMHESDAEEQSDEEWEVQDIIDCKLDRRGGLLYRVVWIGDWEDTWEPSHLLNCPELVRAFHVAHPTKRHTTSVVMQCKRGRPPEKSRRLR